MRWWTSLKTTLCEFLVFLFSFPSIAWSVKKLSAQILQRNCTVCYVGQCVLCTSQSKFPPPPHPSPGKAGTLAEQNQSSTVLVRGVLDKNCFSQYLNWRIQLEAWSRELCVANNWRSRALQNKFKRRKL